MLISLTMTSKTDNSEEELTNDWRTKDNFYPKVLTLVFLIREHARNKKILMIFQPARPFLLHKNEQGGKPYLVNLVPLLAYYNLLAY